MVGASERFHERFDEAVDLLFAVLAACGYAQARSPSIGIWVEGGMRPMLMDVIYRLGEGGLGGSSPAAGMSEGRRGAQREIQPAM